MDFPRVSWRLPRGGAAVVAVQGSACLRKGPYLLYTGDETSMMVFWQLDETATCSLRWRLDTSYSTTGITTEEFNQDHQHRWLIRDLFPGSRYYYEEGVGDATHAGSFFAAPSSSADTVKFLGYGDTRTFIDDHESV